MIDCVELNSVRKGTEGWKEGRKEGRDGGRKRVREEGKKGKKEGKCMSGTTDGECHIETRTKKDGGGPISIGKREETWGKHSAKPRTRPPQAYYLPGK